jgi:tetratricopeptide (TPR) repeat protein
MKCSSPKSVNLSKLRHCHLASATCSAIAVLSLLAPYASSAQTPPRHSPPTQNSVSPPTELETRLANAHAARDSGDPAAAQLANERLIAVALRELARLRLAESAYPQAVELYTSSLHFEDVPGAHLDLATAEIQSGKLKDAIEQAQQVHAANPKDLRADRVLASALTQNGDYAQAVEHFTRIARADPSVENLYPLAMCLLQTRKPDDKVRAVAVFDQMKQIAGDGGSLHVLFGRAYRDADDMPSAIREFQRAVAIDPRTPHAHYFLGLAQLFLKDWKPTPEAEAELRKEVEIYPHDYLANYMLGFLISGERRYDESNMYLKAAAEIDPSAPEPFLYLGLNAYSQQDMHSAEEMLRKAVLLTGNDEERSNYQIRRAYVELGRILATSGRREESEVYLTKARNLQNRTMEQSQQQVASIVLAGGAGSAAAVMPLSRQQENQSAPILQSSTDSAVKIDPSAISTNKLTPEQRAAVEAQENELRSILGLAFNDLGTSDAIRGQYSKALGNYQQAERWDSSLPGLEKNLGQCAFRAGDYPEAIRGLSRALEQKPEALALRAQLGMSYFATNQYAQAARIFTPLGTRGMQDAEIGYAWAASLAHTGDMKSASEVLTAFEGEQRPEQTLLLVGQLWTEIGDYARATSTLQRSLTANPSLLKAHFYSGLAYIRWQHWPEAAKEFQAELDLSPGDPDAQYHLGFVYMQESKIDEASALFQQIVAAHPDYANAQYELGKILFDRGQAADAVKYLEAAARLEPQTGYLHYQLQAAYRKENRVADADRELEIYKQIKAASRDRAAEAVKSNP